MALPDSEHYEIQVTADPEHENLECYGVIDKDNKVINYYDNLLPRAYEAMVNMEEKYAEMEAHIRGEPSLQLVGTESIEH